MSVFDHDTEKDADATARLIASHVTLGVDVQGYYHHLDRDSGTVHRVAHTGARDYVVPLNELDSIATTADGVAVYLDHVAEHVGWAHRQHVDPLGRFR